MRSVFETSLGIEAHLIKNLLAMHDLQSEIFGEHLQGGIGDLQAQGIIRVMVSDEDYASAHKIVADWEAAQPAIVAETKPSRKANFGSILLSFILGGLMVFALMQTPISESGIDYDGDSQLDEQWHYRGEYLSTFEIDNNRDGIFDDVWKYDVRGLLKSYSSDMNFDGRKEVRCRIRQGLTVTCAMDIDNDGFDEYLESYRHGVLHSISMFNPDTKALKKRQFFEGWLLVRDEIDLDGDGVLETQRQYDNYEELIAK